MPEPLTIKSDLPAPHTAEVEALVIKHHTEIDRIQAMDTPEQQAVFRSLGIDPKALEDHYKPLIEKAEQLRRRDAKASGETKLMGWSSFLLGGGGTLAMGDKLGSKITRIFLVPIAAVTSGVLGAFVGSRVFSGNIREESRKLNVDSRNALQRELAIALENKERGQAPAPIPETGSDAVAVAAGSAARNVLPRETGYAARVTAEKAAAAGAEAQRT